LKPSVVPVVSGIPAAIDPIKHPVARELAPAGLRSGPKIL
jgi:hypothetical protein